ncbi:MAG: pilus assembly protein TadG-related protein [Alphaproteobacteria bacterium]|nr:pilus assembly protein TadG-related protein [Alphaproteobacteria bacterium]
MMPVFAAVLLVATTAAALTVDIGRAHAVRSDLLGAAEAAAIAAAVMLPDRREARKAAERAVRMNLPDHENLLRDDDLEFGYWDAASQSIVVDEDAASAVRVTVRRAESRGNGLETLFAGVFGEDLLDVEGSAAAGKRGVACLIALDPDGKGLKLNGQADLELTACGAQINADGKHALFVSGKSSLISDSICVSGSASIKGGADVSPQPSEYCPPHADPMADMVMPEVGPCTDTGVEYKNHVGTLTAGRVFCEGLKISGSSRITLQPGLYVIDNGKFELRDDAILQGEGVTIMLRGEKSELDFKNRAALDLAAPTEGPLKGLLIFQAEGADKENKWNSDAPSQLTGVVYLPEGRFTSFISSNITGSEACFVLIVKELKLNGKADMSIDLSSTACRQSLPNAFSRSIVLLS